MFHIKHVAATTTPLLVVVVVVVAVVVVAAVGGAGAGAAPKPQVQKAQETLHDTYKHTKPCALDITRIIGVTYYEHKTPGYSHWVIMREPH